MVVAILIQLINKGRASLLCLLVLFSFASFWLTYLCIDDAFNFYVAECLRSSFLCFSMCSIISIKNERTATYLIYSILLATQTFVNLSQLLANASGYTDPIYMALSIVEVSLFIYGHLKLQRQNNGNADNNYIDCDLSAWRACLCNRKANQEAEK